MYAIIDCNSFYCSCESVFRPDIDSKAEPIVVLSNNDGCIIARNAKAKEYGVEMAGPEFKARPLLEKHGAHVFSSNYTLYADLSRRVMNVIGMFCPEIEVYSIDECFAKLDGLTIPDMVEFARRLRATVLQAVKIPVSIGIAPTKTLAKAANRGAKKSDGVRVLNDPAECEAYLKQFPVGDVWGIGYRHQERLERQNVKTAYDFTQMPQGWVRQHMSVVGERTYLELRGTPCLEMQPQRESKDTICTSRSFGKLLSELEPITDAVATHAHRCAEKLRAQKSAAQMVHVFLYTNRHRYDLPQYNPSVTRLLPVASAGTPEIVSTAVSILKQMYRPGYRYMKAGVIVMGIVPENPLQGDLFDTVNRAAQARVCQAMDNLNRRYGKDVVRTLRQGFNEQTWGLRCTRRTRAYTTRLSDLPVVWTDPPTPEQKERNRAFQEVYRKKPSPLEVRDGKWTGGVNRLLPVRIQ